MQSERVEVSVACICAEPAPTFAFSIATFSQQSELLHLMGHCMQSCKHKAVKEAVKPSCSLMPYNKTTLLDTYAATAQNLVSGICYIVSV